MGRYSVPQFIESESKIMPFLTFKQFFWLVGGAGLCVLSFYLLPFTFFLVIAVITAFVVAISAFVKVDDELVVKRIFKALSFSIRTKNYTWQRKEAPPPEVIKKQPKLKEIVKELEHKEAPSMSMQKGKLMNIKRQIETRK